MKERERERSGDVSGNKPSSEYIRAFPVNPPKDHSGGDFSPILIMRNQSPAAGVCLAVDRHCHPVSATLAETTQPHTHAQRERERETKPFGGSSSLSALCFCLLFFVSPAFFPRFFCRTKMRVTCFAFIRAPFAVLDVVPRHRQRFVSACSSRRPSSSAFPEEQKYATRCALIHSAHTFAGL
jgi:hypothetical protein